MISFHKLSKSLVALTWMVRWSIFIIHTIYNYNPKIILQNTIIMQKYTTINTALFEHVNLINTALFEHVNHII